MSILIEFVFHVARLLSFLFDYTFYWAVRTELREGPSLIVRFSALWEWVFISAFACWCQNCYFSQGWNTNSFHACNNTNLYNGNDTFIYEWLVIISLGISPCSCFIQFWDTNTYLLNFWGYMHCITYQGESWSCSFRTLPLTKLLLVKTMEMQRCSRSLVAMDATLIFKPFPNDRKDAASAVIEFTKFQVFLEIVLWRCYATPKLHLLDNWAILTITVNHGEATMNCTVINTYA